MGDAYIKTLGVEIQSNENCKSALIRHAKEQQWSESKKKRCLKRLNKKMCSGTSRLEWWNKHLCKLGYEEQPTITKCRESFDGIFINIYDLESGRFEKQHKDIKALRNYTKKNQLFYPRQEAKARDLNVFLKVLF